MAENEKNSFSEMINSGETKILPPDYTLKKLIGENIDIKEIFNEEVVAKAQQTIDQHKDSFLEWVVKDVASLNESYQKAETASARKKNIGEIEHTAHRMKSQAGMFNYGLATQIAKSLELFCYKHPKPTDEQMVVVRKHIDTLTVIFSQSITGDGGVVGSELLDNLSKLVDRYN